MREDAGVFLFLSRNSVEKTPVLKYRSLIQLQNSMKYSNHNSSAFQLSVLSLAVLPSHRWSNSPLTGGRRSYHIFVTLVLNAAASINPASSRKPNASMP